MFLKAKKFPIDISEVKRLFKIRHYLNFNNFKYQIQHIFYMLERYEQSILLKLKNKSLKSETNRRNKMAA